MRYLLAGVLVLCVFVITIKLGHIPSNYPTYPNNVSATHMGPVYTNITSNYTQSCIDEYIKCDTTNRDITITLLTASGNAGFGPWVKKASANNKCRIDGNGAEVIEGFAIYSSLDKANESIKLISNGTNYDQF